MLKNAQRQYKFQVNATHWLYVWIIGLITNLILRNSEYIPLKKMNYVFF